MATDRKMEILDGFMRLVSRFGFDKTTMQDVAKEVGISVGVIYKDFKNKEDLVDTYIHRVLQRLSFSAQQILEQDLPAEQLLHDIIVDLFQNIGKLTMEDRGFWQFLKGDEGLKYFRNHTPLRKQDPIEITKRIEWVMEKGVQDGSFAIADVPKTAKLYLEALKAYFSEFLVFEQNQDEVLAKVEDMQTLLLQAIRKR